MTRQWLVGLMCVAGWIGLPLSASESPPLTPKALEYFVVVTGGELLEGAYGDAHTPFITRQLRLLGFRCQGALIVDDRPSEILEALQFATNHAQLIIVTGGLGPTPNDITRETLSRFTGIELYEQPEVVNDMARRFGQSKDGLRANLRRQALVPKRGGFLRNPFGTAVGLVFDTPGPLIVALPGPPRELQGMVTDELFPLLQARYGVQPVGATLTLRFVGVGQSQIDQTIKENVALPTNVVITSLFEGGRVDFTFAMPGNSEADRRQLEGVGKRLREVLGNFYYADDGSSLEEICLRRMQPRGASLAIAEVATGGRVAASLSAQPSGPTMLLGAFAAPNAQAIARLLQLPKDAAPADSSEFVEKIAEGAALRTGSAWALAIGPLVSQNGKPGTVWVACREPGGKTEVQQIALRDASELAYPPFATQLFDRLRRQLK